MSIEIKKKFDYTVSIQQGTNNLIGCSKADWLGVKPGHYVIIGGDREYYKVVEKNKFFYIKDATVLEDGNLSIEENTNIRISPNDSLVFTHKEFEVTDLAGVEATGNNYEVGDILKPNSGEVRFNTFDEVEIPAQFRVDEVDESGAITVLSMTNKGMYSEAPTDTTNLPGGNGTGASINITTSLLEDRSTEERTVTSVSLEGENSTIISLDHPLPPKVLEGKISIHKWSILLDMNYPKDSRVNVSYKIVKDFRPITISPSSQEIYERLIPCYTTKELKLLIKSCMT